MGWSTSCLVAVVVAWALVAAAPGTAEGFAGVSEARIDFEAGVPRLSLNGKPVPPIIFFFNTDIPGPKSEAYLEQQVRLAAEHGIHLYSLPLRCPRRPDGVTPNYEYSDSLLEKFITVDPEALFFLRVYPGPDPSWRAWRDIPEGEVASFADGSKGYVSIASDAFRRASDEDLAGVIRHFEHGPLGKRVFAYHPGGPEHEMFLDRYREKGPDYCAANQRRFRAWLRARYRTDEALREAWGRADITVDTASVPRSEPGRFPMHGGPGPVRVFYDLPRQQDWVDFSDYSNDLVAEQIIHWAKLVKAETSGRKLTAFFYGYTFELPGSFSGHYRLGRVLACPEVDILAGPCSYVDRPVGGAGGFMSLVDTVTAHGKLWINEDDSRTSLMNVSDMPPGWEAFNLPIMARDLHETVNILERNFASVLARRAGTWWMDLCSAGAFNDASLWDMLRDRTAWYEEMYHHPAAYRPEVAVVVDEESKCCVKSDWDANCWTMYAARDESAKTGAAVGYYSLDDFTAEVIPACKVYVFANAFRLTDAQVQRIHRRLDREHATAVWVYAPGYLGAHGADVRQAGRLTGIALAVKDGSQGSEGLGLLQGESWGVAVAVSPRLVVTDQNAEPLGRYRSDGCLSAAQAGTGGHRSIFVGDMQVSAGLLRRLFEGAGVHLWTSGREVIQTDGRLLMVHSGEAGVKPITLPEGVEATAIKGEIVRRDGRTLYARFERGDSLWFRLAAAR